ncbi:DUF3450 family protein [Coraliomargarita sinensis]|uniref:DUF3450 family protein n=1 Tax=Coraliomargarita sinensis TaxID=2174842 RepID=UPI001E3B8A95|nr:DUF3450 family protein [Coraliomargarita sinensis]
MASLLWGTNPLLSSPEALDTARATVKEWAATEKAISREAAEWSGRKILLQDLIEVAQQRMDRLQAELEKGQDSLSASDEARAKLLDREEAVAVEAEQIENFLADLEARLQALRPQLPEPLEKELAPIYQRIPADPAETTLALGERMRTAVSLLAKIRQFDGKLTLAESLKMLPGSDEVASVRTLYIGLGQAYYLAPEDAGYGSPGPEGWVWQSELKLRKAIQEVIVLAEGGAMEPKFVDLPVVLSSAKGGAE